MKLSTQITVMLVLVATLPLVVIGALATLDVRQTLVNATSQQLHVVNAQRMAQVDRWMKGNGQHLRSLAQRPLVVQSTFELSNYEPDSAPARIAAAKMLHDHLNPAINDLDNWSRMFVLHPETGQVLVSTDSRLEGKFREHFPYFINGRDATHYQQPFYDIALDEIAIGISTPIRNDANKTVAVLVGYLALEELEDIVDDVTPEADTRETYIVNEFGFLVAGRRLTPGAALATEVHSVGVSDCLQGNHGDQQYLDYRDVPVIGSYDWMDQYQLCVITEIDRAEATAPANTLATRFTVVTFIMGVVGALSGFGLAQWVNRPLAQLVIGANALGDGNLDYRVDVNRRDELGTLATAFNDMAANLKNVTASRDDLDREVQRREQTEAALQKQAVELRRSNEELEQFAYVASHDLQEPLRMVTSYLQLLERRYKGKLDSDADEFIGYAVDGASRMKVLIQDLLLYSRVQTRGLSFVWFSLNDVLRNVLHDLQMRIEETDAIVTCDATLPNTLGDQSQIEQVMKNIIANGLKFVRDEQPTIHIGYQQTETEHLLSIRDNGIGLENDYAERIFLIFQRLHSREEYEGTGIGLAISRRIIDRHGGRIWVESVVGEGSTFFFTLPIEARDQDDFETS